MLTKLIGGVDADNANTSSKTVETPDPFVRAEMFQRNQTHMGRAEAVISGTVAECAAMQMCRMSRARQAAGTSCIDAMLLKASAHHEISYAVYHYPGELKPHECVMSIQWAWADEHRNKLEVLFTSTPYVRERASKISANKLMCLHPPPPLIVFFSRRYFHCITKQGERRLVSLTDPDFPNAHDYHKYREVSKRYPSRAFGAFARSVPPCPPRPPAPLPPPTPRPLLPPFPAGYQHHVHVRSTARPHCIGNDRRS